MGSQDIGLVSCGSDVLSPEWWCSFSFCPRIDINMRNVSALRDHISDHLIRSRSKCLIGRGLGELSQHFRKHGRWLYVRCIETYKEESRCCSCGVTFVVSEG